MSRKRKLEVGNLYDLADLKPHLCFKVIEETDRAKFNNEYPMDHRLGYSPDCLFCKMDNRSLKHFVCIRYEYDGGNVVIRLKLICAKRTCFLNEKEAIPIIYTKVILARTRDEFDTYSCDQQTTMKGTFCTHCGFETGVLDMDREFNHFTQIRFMKDRRVFDLKHVCKHRHLPEPKSK